MQLLRRAWHRNLILMHRSCQLSSHCCLHILSNNFQSLSRTMDQVTPMCFFSFIGVMCFKWCNCFGYMKHLFPLHPNHTYFQIVHFLNDDYLILVEYCNSIQLLDPPCQF